MLQVDAGPGQEFRGIRAGRGRYLYIVMREADYGYTDGGLGSVRTNLSKLGTVLVLRA